MRTYFDTSVLLKTYVREANTPDALAILRASAPPVAFSHLLELELRTALRNRQGRGELTAAELRAVLRAVESDLAGGILGRPDYDLDSVYRRAEVLSAKHAAATLTRSADLWHIAAALETGCSIFASFDERQRQCATLAGLKVNPAKAGKARS